jgi:fumarate hydratase class II
MHIAAVLAVEGRLLPALWELRRTFETLSEKYADIVKIGRTHLL